MLSVLLAGGSAATRRGIRTVLSFDPCIQVVDEARTCADLVALAGQHRPAAVVLDPDLPGGPLPALAELMATHPVPVVVYGAAARTSVAAQAELRAAGAVDVIVRPTLEGLRPAAGRADQAGADLVECLRLAARIKVIRHPRGRLARPPRQRDGEADASRSGRRRSPIPIVVIGASTGGPSALGQLLAELPADLPAAVVVAQHMPESFLPGLAGWLDSCCPLPVSLGSDGAVLRGGEVLLCPGGIDSTVAPSLSAEPAAGRLRCLPPRPPAHHIPSVDRAFMSVAETAGPAAVGVLLTGMGRDGAAGMAALRAVGAATVAQDETTSAIYGMPRAAIAAGAVDHVLPLPEIAPTLIGLVGSLTAQRAAR
jgi:two-component system chemotaxis response regulator CheB